MREERFGATVEYNAANGVPNIYLHGTRARLKAWQHGERVIILVRDPEATKTTRQRAYYFGAIIKEAVAGYQDLGYDHATKDNVRYELETLSPHTKRDGLEPGTTRQIGISAMTMHEMAEHIDFCIRFVADNLGRVVLDPETWYNDQYG